MNVNINVISDRNKHQINRNNTGTLQSVPNKTPMKPFMSIYDTPNLYKYNISFSGKHNLFNKAKCFIFLTDGIICPYSGIKMVPKTKYTQELTSDTLSGTSRSAIKVLSQFEENMFDVERNVFETIKELSKSNPKYSLSELLMLCKPINLKTLEKSQHNIISNIETLSNNLPQDSLSKQALYDVLNESKNLIKDNKIGQNFKRQVFISKLNQIEEAIPNHQTEEKLTFNKICAVAQELTSSKNDMSAFIVKYANRTSREIGQRLVEPSVSTFEHVKLNCEDGEMILNNCLAVSKKFNNEERKKRAIVDFVELYPNISMNCQKYIDSVIEIINSKNLVQYASYPRDIAATLLSESKGLIVLNCSKLKVKPTSILSSKN